MGFLTLGCRKIKMWTFVFKTFVSIGGRATCWKKFSNYSNVLRHTSLLNPIKNDDLLIWSSYMLKKGEQHRRKQPVGGRPPRYAPAPLLPRWAPKRLAHRNVAAVSHAQYVHTLTVTAAWRVKAADRGDLDLESGVRVTYDVGYPCANFSLPRPLCSRLRPDVGDSQTSDKSIA